MRDWNELLFTPYLETDQKANLKKHPNNMYFRNNYTLTLHLRPLAQSVLALLTTILEQKVDQYGF